jgi:hypothetical protein
LTEASSRIITKTRNSTFNPLNLGSAMKQLGPHKKYVILAIVIQSIVVVLLGYYLFKARAEKTENKGEKAKAVFIPQGHEFRLSKQAAQLSYIQPSPEASPRPRLHG